MDRWIRHLKEPSIPSLTMMKGQIHAGDPTVTEKLLEDIARSLKTRVHSRRQDLICAIKQNGGCTKAFPDLKQLSPMDLGKLCSWLVVWTNACTVCRTETTKNSCILCYNMYHHCLFHKCDHPWEKGVWVNFGQYEIIASVHSSGYNASIYVD